MTAVTFLYLFRYHILLLFFLSIYSVTSAQNQFYNLDVSNGLPSNQVYRTLTDTNGFLWIATNKGILKYNGYDLKLFNSSNGIRNDDVWNIFEDKKGRIWLSNISDDIGYIYQDQYHKAYLKQPESIYPIDFVNHRNGIAFITGDRSYIQHICIEENDTLYSYNKYNNDTAINMLHESLGLIYAREHRIRIAHIDFKKIPSTLLHTKGFVREAGDIRLTGDYIIPVSKFGTDTILRIVNVVEDKAYNFTIDPDEYPLMPMDDKYFIYFTTTKRVYKLNKNLAVIATISPHSLSDLSQTKLKLSTFSDDPFTNRSIATQNAGVFIQVPFRNFKKSNRSFLSEVYLGNYRDSIHFWWNSNDKLLLAYTAQKHLYTKSFPSISNIQKITALGSDKLILLNNVRSYHLFGDSVSYIFSKKNTSFIKYPGGKWLLINSLHLSDADFFATIPRSFKECIVDTNGIYHVLSIGMGYARINFRNDTTSTEFLDYNNRFTVLAYSKPLNIYIAAAKTALLIEKEDGVIKFTADQLSMLGIYNIQQILTDSLGNIFIKTSDKLIVYNALKGRYKYLFRNYNLTNTTVCIFQNKLILAGRFGISYCAIDPYFKFSAPRTFLNYKSQNYSSINSSYIIADTLYLDSDKGGYAVSLNTQQFQADYAYNVQLKNRLFISSKQFNRVVSYIDTIPVTQGDYNLNFDFINPYGDGVVKYSYKIDNDTSGKWLYANNVELPELTPGVYHELRLTVSDYSWKTNEYKLYLYIIPYWWQTPVGKIWLTILIGLGVTMATVSIILTTRYVLNKRHARENKYLELELKSIYAQLNPHFIFNTLSNIVYYIKKDRKQEAYKYLNTFSKLLRSYIKSSRNKWLPLSEELENIENYIQLQQARFDDKFDYTINIDHNLDTHNILLPSLLLQPLVENAIHHGLQPKTEKGHLTLSFKTTNDKNIITIIIEDDGIGRAKAKQFANNSVNKKESFGSNLIEDLITIYKRYELFSIDIEYLDKTEPLTGTIVTLTIKYEP